MSRDTVTRVANLEVQIGSMLNNQENMSEDLASDRKGLAHLEETILKLELVSCEELLRRAYIQFSKDYVGKEDFALKSAGARVVKSLTSSSSLCPSRSFWPFSTSPQCTHNPDIVLNEDLHAGSCWKVEETPSQLGIALAEPIVITDITIDHIPQELTHEIGLAPKNIVVWGVLDGQDNIEKTICISFRTG
ncbi:hypothetical protein SERLA73DRAFT_182953 [Serpula lacrymans var. lacrymans S7.3]|uniref:SUN domain-containing protein n=1 Tax=Serpula lacrymans var. lacrymans (strain S7.3) TaxID=936435 RepID=F8Q1A4_SERL3|nr:hypothetical protein SERLA73DRAFT_182953 [Serpula lacrymans var. lacrymans S7.3]